MDLTNLTNEELVSLIATGAYEGPAYEQLLRNLRPMICKIAYKHLRPITIYDEDDYVQEGLMVMWKLITRSYRPGASFSNLFYTAYERRCINLYRNYVMKNMLQLNETEDYYFYGYHVGYFVEAEFAQEYREKKRQWYLASREAAPLKEKKPKMTEEEKKEKRRQYYLAHREEYIEKKRKWYREHHDYALQYQKAYSQGVRIGHKGPCKKS